MFERHQEGNLTDSWLNHQAEKSTQLHPWLTESPRLHNQPITLYDDSSVFPKLSQRADTLVQQGFNRFPILPVDLFSDKVNDQTVIQSSIG
ncbi:hypothetical protein RRG08_042617 [Elysia crispata]|uniref:Uncharacterized protein n=1 Tax=Elysia crispata TaxID=231223 RepID=A0AAE0XQD1_9GAST|nr:hypothetical protein RRG08_042617 [Elysia crispata]